jgi:hypothetical protein
MHDISRKIVGELRRGSAAPHLLPVGGASLSIKCTCVASGAAFMRAT